MNKVFQFDLLKFFKSHAQPLYFGIFKGLLYKKFTWYVYVQVYIKMNNL